MEAVECRWVDEQDMGHSVLLVGLHASVQRAWMTMVGIGRDFVITPLRSVTDEPVPLEECVHFYVHARFAFYEEFRGNA